MLQTSILIKNLTLKIKEALDAPIDKESDSEKVKQELAENLANAIGGEMETWIKTATVTVAPGIPVSTSGSPTSQVGATTGTGAAKIT